jgi:CRISPR/Cas system-associated exonuclease Cas4 (RecB family)
MDCPVKYALRYKAKVEPEFITSKEAYSKTLHTCIYHFWYKLMDGGKVTEDDILDKWESLWFEGHKVSKEDVMYGTKKEKTDMGYKGVGILQSFFRNVKYNPGVPICIAKEYSAPIGDNFITGKFELVREVKDNATNRRVIEIVDYKSGDIVPDNILVDSDIALTMQSYGFRHMFQSREQRLTYYYLKAGREIQTHREAWQYKKMISTVTNVCKAIEQSIYYPRQSYLCKSCPFKNFCDDWIG